MTKNDCYKAGAWLDSHYDPADNLYIGALSILGAIGCAVDRVDAGSSVIHIIYPPAKGGVQQVGLFNINNERKSK